jgi:hypothetical protein
MNDKVRAEIAEIFNRSKNRTSIGRTESITDVMALIAQRELEKLTAHKYGLGE